MSFTPSVEEQTLLADTFRRAEETMTPQERMSEWLTGAGFIVAATAIWLANPPHHFDAGPAFICFVLLVIATMVRFDTPLGFTVATQLAFVPLLFAVPLALVAPIVVGAMMLERLPAVVAGKTRPARLLQVIGNSWFVIGPVAVFTIAGKSPDQASPVLLIAALAAQFAVDFVASAIRLSIARDASFTPGLADAWVYGIDAALSGVALVVAQDIHRTPAAPVVLLPLLGLLAMFARERHDRMQKLIELNDAYHGTALVLGDVVEADDGYTGQHSRGVVALTLAVAGRIGLNAEQRRNLEFGALLHDVGKIAIPKEIINKPGKLNSDEWTIIKTHTLEGQKLLDTVGGFMRDVGLIVRSHHERWDGAGYPDGLAGEEIPLEARVIACCDTWSAMRTDRSYRKAIAYELAVAEIRSVSGSQLDPRIVEALLATVADDQAAAAALAARQAAAHSTPSSSEPLLRSVAAS
jgi:putative nucleotidyltransferase with HDIG domain